MNATIKIFLRTDYQKKDKSYPIYLRLTLKRRIRSYSLDISTSEKNWDRKKTLIKKSDPDYQYKNSLIDFYYNKARNIVFELMVNNRPLTLSNFDILFKSNLRRNTLLFEFIQQEIAKSLKNKFSYETLRFYESQISKLKKFRPIIYINEIDLDFIKSYESFMISVLHNGSNTAKKSLSFLKACLNKAIKSGLIKENPFKDYKIGKIEGNREFLSRYELNILENIYNASKLKKGQQNVLKYFLFGCYSGLRYSDIKELRFKHILNDIISINMHKVNNNVRIPLIPQAKKLLGNGFNEQKVFKVITEQATNRYLKDIMKISGINKIITFHCARHTFATNGISLGIPIEIISKLLGHKDLKTTMIYTKIVDDVKIREMKKWNML